jgi:hypothetical protein
MAVTDEGNRVSLEVVTICRAQFSGGSRDNLEEQPYTASLINCRVWLRSVTPWVSVAFLMSVPIRIRMCIAMKMELK